MKVLLTGAAGFVGSRVARVLAREGCEVHAWTRGDPRGRLEAVVHEVRVDAFDLSDTASLGTRVAELRPELCIHCAWNAVPGEYLHSDENRAHLEIGLRLADALVDAGCRRLVGIGTCFEYDTSVGVLSEESPVNPATPYAESKLALFRALDERCADAGMSFAWARLFYLYGPGEHERRLVPSVILALLDGRAAQTTPGDQLRDFLYVDDVAEALWGIARSGVAGPVNVGSGRAIAVRDVVLELARIVGRPELVELGALPYPPGEPALVQADVRRLVEECGWSPRFSLEQGLEASVRWWRDRRSP
ncbi:MAG TPA: NAD(P)-dependent oxidoreductase [Gaiella sp.]|jgi:nucleoside-diphosphate-sugar epimerase